MKIKSIKEIEYNEDVYNLRIKDNHNYFANNICVSNCHFTDTKSIQTVLSKVNSEIRFGMSGTTGVTGSRKEFAGAYTIQSLLGPVVHKVTPDMIIQKGYATPVNVRVLYLDYLDLKVKENLYAIRSKRTVDGSKLLRIERNLILENKKRFDFITNMISKVTKNSLVFFTDIKNQYGKKIYERLKEQCSDEYKIMYIDGATSSQIRDSYKQLMDDPEDSRIKILVASFGTFSTGISINNVHNIFLTESYKSHKIVKQTIGRGMRLHESKTMLNMIDFVDNFSFKNSKNLTYNHGKERQKIYAEEKFNFTEYNIEL